MHSLGGASAWLAMQQQMAKKQAAHELARVTDPATSHEAATRASEFSQSHEKRILAVLSNRGAGTAEYIAKHCGLTVVQIDRRLPDLQRKGLARPTGVSFNGFRVWAAV